MFDNIKNIYIIILWLFNCFILLGQADSIQYSSIKHPNSILLDEIKLNEKIKKNFSLKDYKRLEYRVLKVYPYVDSISHILGDIDVGLSQLTRKRLYKRYTRKYQKKIMNQFSAKISNLTRKEGVILTKLIFREFDVTAYEMIVSYRGGVNAFFWNKLARLYDGNLKLKYNPSLDVEDFFIEQIIEKNFKE